MAELRYKMYPKSNIIRNWELLLAMTEEEVQALEEEWGEIKEYNEKVQQEIYEQRKAEQEEIEAFLKSKGIETKRYSKSSTFKVLRYQKWFEKNILDVIREKYPTNIPNYPYAGISNQKVKGIEIYNNCSPTTLTELHNRVNYQYNQKKQEADKQNKLLIASIQYATEHNVNIEGYESEAIIRTVDDYAKERYREKNIPDGTKIELKNECYDCSTYIVGEHRCSCGNRRIGMTVEGNIIDGFYHYPEAY